MASKPPTPSEPPVPPIPPVPPVPPVPPPPAPETGKRNNKQLMTGVAMGIGSAALVAALLYASRSKKGDRKS